MPGRGKGVGNRLGDVSQTEDSGPAPESRGTHAHVRVSYKPNPDRGTSFLSFTSFLASRAGVRYYDSVSKFQIPIQLCIIWIMYSPPGSSSPDVLQLHPKDVGLRSKNSKRAAQSQVHGISVKALKLNCFPVFGNNTKPFSCKWRPLSGALGNPWQKVSWGGSSQDLELSVYLHISPGANCEGLSMPEGEPEI